jgi:hypothetical protein
MGHPPPESVKRMVQANVRLLRGLFCLQRKEDDASGLNRLEVNGPKPGLGGRRSPRRTAFKFAFREACHRRRTILRTGFFSTSSLPMLRRLGPAQTNHCPGQE